jgi:signal transduction histidine kinase
MVKPIIAVAAVAAVLGMGSVCAADNYATAKEAEDMVAKAVKAVGADKAAAFKEITGKDKKWVDRDLYPVVYDMSGKCLAHGQNEKQVGKDLIDLADADGKEFIKERVELAKSKGKFWQDYKFTDPVSKKILPKAAYCEKTGELIVCAGVYKR